MKKVKKLLAILLVITALLMVSVCAVEDDANAPETCEHNMSQIEAVEATCTENGNIAYYKCSKCGEIFSDENGESVITEDSVIVKTTGHSYGEWTVVENSTSTAQGKKERTCSKCGDKQTESIDPVVHGQTCASSTFSDVNKSESNWTHLPIDYALEKGYMAGTSSTAFSPNGVVTRATIAQILYARDGKPEVTNTAFSDVQNGKWYYKSVNWAAEKGLVSGYGNGKFGPNDAVTREQMALILYKYAQYKGMNLDLTGSFTTNYGISSWALNGLKWAVGHNIISGTTKGIEAKGTATRAQIAVMLKAFDENAGNAGVSKTISNPDYSVKTTSTTTTTTSKATTSNTSKSTTTTTTSNKTTTTSNTNKTTTTSVTNSTSTSRTYYYTQYGKKYHYNRNCKGLNNANKIYSSSSKPSGRTACSICAS